MKQLIAIMLLAQLATVPDVLDPNKIHVTKDGVKQYEIRRDVLNPNHYRVYDRNGGLKGTWKKDVLFPERYRFEENR